jgi:hypothetical protein
VQAFIDAHKVVHRGPHAWSVVRKGDKAVLEQGIAVKDGRLARARRAWRASRARPPSPNP